MSYVVLARKWRPQTFDDVLGQEHVTRTLKNAIEADRVAHAFLFSGPRGVGKTSAARILAKALCCTTHDGPTATPCGTCPACLEITEGRSTDVFEIDAASHTGVDNVRDIVDNARYLPSSARFKIYVIDEVHMLSQGAFNALLKTLEEPPPHVKFILATTDVHKVPVTILSRVQRYDFRRIPGPRIAARLSEILTEEARDHDPDALSLIAREAEGSMRDAQSLLEQVLAYAGERSLDAALIREALGVVDAESVHGTVDALLQREPAAVFERVRLVYERGLDLVRFTDALAEHVRDLLVARVLPDPSTALDRPQDEIKELIETSRAYEPVTFERLFAQISPLVEEVGNSPHPRFTLEIGLASLAEAPPEVDLQLLVEQLEDLEGAVRSGGGGPSGSGRAGRPAGSAAGPGRADRDRAADSSARSGGRAAGSSARSARDQQPEARRPPAERPSSTPETEQSAAPTGGKPAAPASAGTDFRSFVDGVKAARPALAASLAQVRPATFGPDVVRLHCQTAFDAKALTATKTRRFLEEQLTSFFGKRVPLEIERVGQLAETDAPSISEEDEAVAGRRQEELEAKARNHPAVKAVERELGGSVTSVRVREE